MAIGMILKKVNALDRKIRKTFNYILNLNNEGDIGDKVEYADAENFLYDDIENQIKEMEDRHKEYKENGGKVTPDMHLILSYPTTFLMTKAEYRKDVKTVLKHLGMDENSCLWAVHSNTKNTHVHLYIDRIDPVTNLFDISRGACFETLKSGTVRRHESNCFQAACFEISKKYNYSTSRYRVDTKGIPQRSVKSNQVRVNPKDKVGYEFALKVQSTIDEFLTKESKSWKELLEVFKLNEISYNTIFSKKEEKVRGAVFIDTKTGYKLKSSALPIGHKDLEKELGVFPFEAKILPEKKVKTQKQIDIEMDKTMYNLMEVFVRSDNWKQLEWGLNKYGYSMMTKGSSFTIVYDIENGNLKTIAPSKIHRSFSFANLKKKWGNPPEGIFEPYCQKPKSHSQTRTKKSFENKTSSKLQESFSLSLAKTQDEFLQNRELYEKIKVIFKQHKVTKISKALVIEFEDGYTLKMHKGKIELVLYKTEDELVAAINSMIQLELVRGWKMENMAFNGSEAFKTKAYAILDERIREQNEHLLSEEVPLERLLEHITTPNVPVELPEDTDTKYDDDDDDDIDIDF